MAARLGAVMRTSASEFLERMWILTRFGCCVQVFHDYVAEATVVRARRGACGRAPM